MKYKIISIILLFFMVTALNAEESVQYKKEKIIMLETIGTLSSSNLYLAYLSLSMIYDKLDESEDNNIMLEITEPVNNTLGIISGQLSFLKDSAVLSKDDKDYIGKIEKALAMMQKDTELLNEYIKERTLESQNIYLEQHIKTGEYLKELFKN